MNHYQGVPARVSYPATLDVPESIAHAICLWLAAHRRAHDARPWPRAATCRAQAVLVLRWMVAGTALTTLARDTKVSWATAYRYLHEALGVIADRAPDLPEVPQRLRERRAVRLSGWDPDPHRPGGPAQPGHGPPPVVFRSWPGRWAATCRW